MVISTFSIQVAQVRYLGHLGCLRELLKLLMQFRCDDRINLRVIGACASLLTSHDAQDSEN